ncbi:hypothetical protein B0H11DRAFT_2256189 [Mycena galericulata]|nr:hypothetical protein B0H11DRAFT_2256189 [Mycena galericulata]
MDWAQDSDLRKRSSGIDGLRCALVLTTRGCTVPDLLNPLGSRSFPKPFAAAPSFVVARPNDPLDAVAPLRTRPESITRFPLVGDVLRLHPERRPRLTFIRTRRILCGKENPLTTRAMESESCALLPAPMPVKPLDDAAWDGRLPSRRAAALAVVSPRCRASKIAGDDGKVKGGDKRTASRLSLSRRHVFGACLHPSARVVASNNDSDNGKAAFAIEGTRRYNAVVETYIINLAGAAACSYRALQPTHTHSAPAPPKKGRQEKRRGILYSDAARAGTRDAASPRCVMLMLYSLPLGALQMVFESRMGYTRPARATRLTLASLCRTCTCS